MDEHFPSTYNYGKGLETDPELDLFGAILCRHMKSIYGCTLSNRIPPTKAAILFNSALNITESILQLKKSVGADYSQQKNYKNQLITMYKQLASHPTIKPQFDKLKGDDN
jgi:hypothetical protein